MKRYQFQLCLGGKGKPPKATIRDPNPTFRGETPLMSGVINLLFSFGKRTYSSKEEYFDQISR